MTGRPLLRLLVLAVVALACGLAADPAAAAFVGENGKISYNRWVYGVRYDVYSVKPDGTGKRFNLLGDGELSVDDPAYSPDGDRIAYAYHWTRGKKLYGALAVENDDPNRNGYLELTVVRSSWGVPWDPTWSPDGSRIAFTSGRDGDYELYVVSASGGAPARLTRNSRPDVEPAWSPDGRRIAFTSRRGGNVDVYVLTLAGGKVTRMTRSPRVEAFPSWSPDGRRIAFWGKGSGDAELYFVDVGTRRVRQVTRNQAPDYDPAWSPDGEKLVFSGRRKGTWDIFTMDEGGGRLRNLTRDKTPDAWPDWQPRCHLTGSEDGPSTLVGTDAPELVCSLGAGDTVDAGGGNDTVFGRDGDDVLDGGEGNDVLVGGPGADTLTGGAGADLLNALDGAGGDVVEGDASDLCYADPADVVTGCAASPFLPGVAAGSAGGLETGAGGRARSTARRWLPQANLFFGE
ncbi:MAG TPA: hypothetical protein VK915_12105 [Gaiellaceae bacterium]|nr:hypothetical protein [Gaiellaceae bacterium]